MGTKILAFSDDFFGEVTRMLNDKEPFLSKINMIIMVNGWMDGKAKDEEMVEMIGQF